MFSNDHVVYESETHNGEERERVQSSWTSVCWIRFSPGRVGGSVSVGLASCDCKSIPLLCNVYMCVCTCVCEREEERDPEIRVCRQNFKEAHQTLFSLSCLILETGLNPQSPPFSKCILSVFSKTSSSSSICPVLICCWCCYYELNNFNTFTSCPH